MEENCCSICLEANDSSSINACPDKSNHCAIHTHCLANYIRNKINNASTGTCPAIYCPEKHKDGVSYIIDYIVWSALLKDHSLVSKYTSLSNSCLTILCGGCHCNRCVGVCVDRPPSSYHETSSSSTSSSLSSDAISTLTALVSSSRALEIEQLLRRYSQGQVSVDYAYTTIFSSMMPKLANLDEKVSWAKFKLLLALIVNPERRTNLTLRYIKDNPKIWTPCCEREHCFKCKTKDFHVGKTCEENLGALDSTVLFCPSCHVALVSYYRFNVQASRKR